MREDNSQILPIVNILDVKTHAQSFDTAVETVLQWAKEARRRYISTCPVYTIMMCRENPSVSKAVNGADMVAADGMPVVWLQRRRGYPNAQRVYGPDLMLAVCEQSVRKGIKHVFWGGEPGVAEILAARLQERFPGLQVVATFSPPFHALTDEPDTEAIARLNVLDAQIVWVGLGSPKQDLWMAQHRRYLTAPVLIGVGAAFDFLAGTKRQAPRWMQRIGLEWFYRLIGEPRRLGRRYIVYNPRFVWALLRHRFRPSS
ncbi:MAG: glycosyltransferase [Chloroflexi bacterium]|nr:MAG: glycosyltransferase [Chloroflexota bacterium]